MPAHSLPHADPAGNPLLAELAAHLAEAGLAVSDPEVDGRVHRVRCACGPSGAPGWYVARPIGTRVVAWHGCWRCTPERQTWTSGNGALSEAERAELERQRARRAKAEAARHEKVAAALAKHLPALPPCPPEHPYLVAKAVRPHGALLWTGPDPHLRPPVLVLPLRDLTGKVWSAQFIDAEGTKLFESGGRVSGCAFTIGMLPEGEGRALVCEGFATGATLFESTGLPVLCAMNAGNLLPVVRAAREVAPKVELLICGDDDWRTVDREGRPMNKGRDAARETAKAVGCRWRVPCFPANRGEKDTDFNDLTRVTNAEDVRQQIAAAWATENAEQGTETGPAPGTESDEATFARLAKLSAADYDRVRMDEAERLGIRASTLDAEVGKRRLTTADGLQGSGDFIREVEPWPEEVNGAEVLDAAVAVLRRYLALPPHAAEALALWLGHAHCFEAFTVTPRLNLTSPEKQCGKTLVLDVLEPMLPRALRTESITTAVLFRLTHAHRPTLLLDEVDTYLPDNDELRGLLNAGHRRGAKAARCEGDNNEVRYFNAFCPVALAGIGQLPGTLHDRSIVVRLTRAKLGEVAARFDSRRTDAERELARKLARWTADNRAKLEACDPAMPPEAFNRLGDNWRPLFAIAEVAGGDWSDKARSAFLALTVGDDPASHSIGAAALADIRAAFAAEGPTVDRLPSQSIAARLVEIEGRPWAEYGKAGKPITANKLARLLARFGVAPRKIRHGGETLQGYYRADFTDAFARYLPPHSPSSNRNTGTTVENTGAAEVFKPEQPQDVFHFENTTSANKDEACSGVPLSEPPHGGKDGSRDTEATQNMPAPAWPGAPPDASTTHDGDADPDWNVPTDAPPADGGKESSAYELL